jgi:DNA-binding NarL/FixJ family response regulator
MVTQGPTLLPCAPQRPQLRVLLAEENSSMRRSLRRLLDGIDGVGVVSESSDLAGIREELRLRKPDVVVVDLRLAGGDVLQFIRDQAGAARHVRIVATTMSSNSVLAARALRAGADAVVLKDRADEQLPAAVEAAVGT